MLPVVEALVAAGVVVSIDTMRAAVAERRVERRRGARQRRHRRPGRPGDAAASWPTPASPYVAHALARAQRRHGSRGGLRRRRRRRASPSCRPGSTTLPSAPASTPSRVVLDPGLGFAKDAEHNWALLARPRRAGRARPPGAGRRLAQGVPRRSCSPTPTASPRPAGARDAATAAVTALAAAAGAWCGAGARGRAPPRDAVGSSPPAALARTAAWAGAVTPTPRPRAVACAPTRLLYDAFETGDLDLMSALWLDGPDAGDGHLRPPRLAHRCTAASAVLRSWSMIMANTSYIQFVLTDVKVAGDRRRRRRHLRGEHAHRPAGDPDACRRGRRRWPAGARSPPTCSAARPDGWRLWLHHASPVLDAATRAGRGRRRDRRPHRRPRHLRRTGHHGVLRRGARDRAAVRRRRRAAPRPRAGRRERRPRRHRDYGELAHAGRRRRSRASRST